MGCRASRIAGISVLHELVAVHANDLAEVVIGIETDRGLWVQALTSRALVVFLGLAGT